MLTIFGRPSESGGFCDGNSRRDFLTVGGAIVGGALALPNILSAETQSGIRSSHKAIINIYLPGGPPHQDMWDLKPDAPVDIRGEFKPIKTNVPGIDICEHFPRMAKMMDKFAIIRSITGSAGDHDAFQCMTGRKRDLKKPGYWPAMGAWVSKALGPVNQAIPPHLTLMYRTGEARWGYPGDGGFIGMAHAPFRLVGDKATGMQSETMTLKGITLEHLQDRVSLGKAFDTLDRKMDQQGVMNGIDSFSQQAMGILTSNKLKDALDLSKEKPEIVARYGVDDPAFERDGAPRMVRNFCIARRLVEAGARVVTLNFTRWDWHGPDGKNFVQGRKDMPLLDQGITALISDLHERGLSDDVSVVVWGEFGRTPRINKDASRDHWPQVSCALMAGGGMKMGQVIGATNRLGEYAVARPVTHQEVFATLYSRLGLDLSKVTIQDATGRPQFLVEDDTAPIKELM
ncbi:DUF1501 domain-containing protein [Zavarzinella formosa]|uniref:DUF1501 domain-containing protein n=1 Tax=Zavarzinella formosa TaxID=360055 RepID=UPI00031D62D6|nr:DUF1501 domain-containing protein [Zavarzinella formosa]